MNPKTLFATLFMLLMYVPTQADNVSIPSLTLKNGRTYEGVTLKKKSESEVSLIHSSGIASVPMAELPTEIAEKLGYSPEKAEALDKARAQAEEQRKTAIADALDFKGLRLRLPLRELPALVDRTLWSFNKLDILRNNVDLKNPNTTLSLDSDNVEERNKRGFTGDQLNDFGAIGKDGFGENAFWYSWASTRAQFVDGQLAEIKVYGSDWTADKLKTHTLRWLELADAGLRKKYGEPTKVLIPLSRFSITDAQAGYVVFVSRWDIRNQTIHLGVTESNSKFIPMIIFQDSALKKKLDALGKGETKL